MKIAIPVSNGILTAHFGHASQFALLDADTDAGKIISRQDIDAPAHEPGLLPAWLKELGADIIIAGGMGQRAQQLFVSNGIEVVVGAPALKPEEIVEAHLAGNLRTGSNICDH
jgi:predicted Fe-Mo cluster-binding NifX family protein